MGTYRKYFVLCIGGGEIGISSTLGWTHPQPQRLRGYAHAWVYVRNEFILNSKLKMSQRLLGQIFPQLMWLVESDVIGQMCTYTGFRQCIGMREKNVRH